MLLEVIPDLSELIFCQKSGILSLQGPTIYFSITDVCGPLHQRVSRDLICATHPVAAYQGQPIHMDMIGLRENCVHLRVLKCFRSGGNFHLAFFIVKSVRLLSSCPDPFRNRTSVMQKHRFNSKIYDTVSAG